MYYDGNKHIKRGSITIMWVGAGSDLVAVSTPKLQIP